MRRCACIRGSNTVHDAVAEMMHSLSMTNCCEFMTANVKNVCSVSLPAYLAAVERTVLLKKLHCFVVLQCGVQ